MNRRTFLRTLGTMSAAVGTGVAAGRSVGAFSLLTASAPGTRATPGGPAVRKHWAWMRGKYASVDEWKRLLAQMRGAGIEPRRSGRADSAR